MWTATRPRGGFTLDEVKPGFRTQAAALDWLDHTIPRGGTPAVIVELASQREDGVSPTPVWTPTWTHA